MFGWLRSLIHKPSFEDAYRYHDGTRWVRGDPMAILRRLSTDENFDYDREAKLSVVPGTVGAVATGKLVEGTRKAFELPSVKEGGLTEPKVAALLLNFMQWLEVVKKNLPLSPPAAPSILDTPDEDLPEGRNLDSTSTAQEQSESSPSPSSPLSTP